MEVSDEHYIRYWATGTQDSSDALFFVMTPSGGEGFKKSPEEAGARFRSYFLSRRNMQLINGPIAENVRGRKLSELENTRFLTALGV